MLSIKISKHTKKEIEKTQARLILEKQIKVTQSEIIDKIIENSIHDDSLIDHLFSPEPNSPSPDKKKVKVKINSRKKPSIKLFPEEWDD